MPNAAKLFSRFLRAVDCVSCAVVLIAFTPLICGSILGAIFDSVRHMKNFITAMWGDHSDRTILLGVIGATIWCVFRWKAMNGPNN